jgi:hypothetical protein
LQQPLFCSWWISSPFLLVAHADAGARATRPIKVIRATKAKPQGMPPVSEMDALEIRGLCNMSGKNTKGSNDERW